MLSSSQERGEAAGRLRFADIRSIQAGDRAELSKTITAEDVQAFARLSGDYNPLHVDESFAKSTSFQKPVVHGVLVASYVSNLVGMQIPGPGALWTSQSFRWLAPVFVGDTVKVAVTAVQVSLGGRVVKIEVSAQNQNGKLVLEGEGAVQVLEPLVRTTEPELAGQVAFVAGLGAETNAATAYAFARRGVRTIVGFAADGTLAEGACQEINSSGGDALAVAVDLASAFSIEAAMRVAQDRFGRAVTLLINDAGQAQSPKAFADLSWEDMDRHLTAQLRGAFLCSQAALPGMLEQRHGRIVNVGAALSWNKPPVQSAPLAVSSAALSSLTRCMAAELGPSGIRVNMISAGLTETGNLMELPERLRKVEAMQTPLRRLASAQDVAEAAVWLCSEAAAYITGADIPVTGGSRM